MNNVSKFDDSTTRGVNVNEVGPGHTPQQTGSPLSRPLPSRRGPDMNKLVNFDPFDNPTT